MSIEYEERPEREDEQGPGHVEPEDPTESPSPGEQDDDDNEQGPGHVPA